MSVRGGLPLRRRTVALLLAGAFAGAGAAPNDIVVAHVGPFSGPAVASCMTASGATMARHRRCARSPALPLETLLAP